jgi:hypothetical protein
MKQSPDSIPSKLGAGGRTMPLPEDVHRRLVARAVTDPDLASLLAMFTKPAETVSEPIDDAIKDAENRQALMRAG